MSSLSRVLCRLTVLSVAIYGACCGECVQSADRLYFKHGNHIDGTHRNFVHDDILWELPTGSRLLIPLDAVDRIEHRRGAGLLSNPDDRLIRDGEATTEEEFPPPISPGYHRLPESLRWLEPTRDSIVHLTEAAEVAFETWTKRIEFGARFLDGNSNEDALNAHSRFERSERTWLGQIDLSAQYGRANGKPTTNRWNGNATFDYGRHGKWIVFATTKNEFNEFQNLDYRGTYSTGIGYRFFNDESRRLILRIGPAVTHERFRDPVVTRTTPDGFGELEIHWPVFKRSEFESKTTVHPSLEDMGIVRLTTQNGLLIRLDEHGTWRLKLGFRFDYNSRPNRDRLPVDFTTSVLLVYTQE